MNVCVCVCVCEGGGVGAFISNTVSVRNIGNQVRTPHLLFAVYEGIYM